MASFSQAGQLHAVHGCSFHVAHSRWQETSLLFLHTSHPRRTIPTGIFSLSLCFSLCDVCDCLTSVAAYLVRLEPLWAAKRRRFVKETTGSVICEKCVYQSRLQVVNTVCGTSSEKAKATSGCSSTVLIFWSSSMSPSDLINWDIHLKNALKSLWSLYDLPFMCEIVLMFVSSLFYVQSSYTKISWANYTLNISILTSSSKKKKKLIQLLKIQAIDIFQWALNVLLFFLELRIYYFDYALKNVGTLDMKWNSRYLSLACSHWLLVVQPLWTPWQRWELNWILAVEAKGRRRENGRARGWTVVNVRQAFNHR